MWSMFKTLAGRSGLIILGFGLLGGCGGAPGEREFERAE